jgi:hypothetical protein
MAFVQPAIRALDEDIDRGQRPPLIAAGAETIWVPSGSGSCGSLQRQLLKSGSKSFSTSWASKPLKKILIPGIDTMFSTPLRIRYAQAQATYLPDGP